MTLTNSNSYIKRKSYISLQGKNQCYTIYKRNPYKLFRKLKYKEMGKGIHTHTHTQKANKKKEGVVILISDKLEFSTLSIKKSDNKGHVIM